MGGYEIYFLPVHNLSKHEFKQEDVNKYVNLAKITVLNLMFIDVRVSSYFLSNQNNWRKAHAYMTHPYAPCKDYGPLNPCFSAVVLYALVNHSICATKATYCLQLDTKVDIENLLIKQYVCSLHCVI